MEPEDVVGREDRGDRTSPAAAEPGGCGHPRLHRLGVQEIAPWPYRVHLVVCAGCQTTLTTESLRSFRRRRRTAY